MSGRQTQESRKASFKKGVTQEDGRRKREENRNGLRRSKLDDTVAKRRQIVSQSTEDSPAMSGVDSIQNPTEIRQEYINQVLSADEEHQLKGTTQFRKILSIEKNPPINEVLATGVVPRLVHFLANAQNPTLRFEAAWAITNIASGNAEQTRAVVGMGAVQVFVSLLSCDYENIREQSVWALGNIAGDSSDLRDFVLSCGIMQPLLHVIISGWERKSLVRNAAWALSNLCRGKPQPKWELVAPALPVLAQLLHHGDQEVLIDTLWSLSYLSDGTDHNIDAVLHSGEGFLSRLLHHLISDSAPIQTPALRTLGNIVTGNDQQTQAALDAGCLRVLKELLTHTKKGIKKEAAWTVSNITAGNKEQTQMCISAGVFEPLITLMINSEFEVKKEATWAISNATSWKSYDQIRYLISLNVARPLCDNLAAKDQKLVQVSLEALENILAIGETYANKYPGQVNSFIEHIEEAEGIEKLEALQSHQNTDLYQKAVDLLEKYFNAEEDNAENLAPSNSMDAATYSFGTNLNTNQVFSF